MISRQNSIPAIRFPKFREEWEYRRVADLCDFIVPGRNKPSKFIGDIPWITTPDIEHNGIIFSSKSKLSITKDEAKRVGSKIVPEKSVIISCVGELGLVAIAGRDIVINQQLHAFIPTEKINNRFLMYGLGLQKRYMDKVATKTAVPYMNKENCNAIPVPYTTLPEQQKIASFLTAVDDKIQQLKKRKRYWSNTKKASCKSSLAKSYALKMIMAMITRIGRRRS